MASSQSSAKNIMQVMPECPICFEVFKEPRLLTKCGHTFCKECLENHVSSTSPHVKAVWCPTCKQEMPLPAEGVQGLPRNYSLQDTIDKLKDISINPAAAATPEDQTNNPSISAKEWYTAKCRKHVTEVANFYCETCKGILICRDCTVLDHRGHHYVNVKEKGDFCTKKLQELIDKHQIMTYEIITVDRSKTIGHIRENTQRLVNEVLEIAARQMRELQAKKDKCVRQAQHTGRFMEEKTDMMYYNDIPIDDIVEMVQRGNEYEILEKFCESERKLNGSLAEMEQKKSAKIIPHMANCLSFKEAGVQLTSQSPLCNLELTDMNWKPVKVINMNYLSDAVSFTTCSTGGWYVLSSHIRNGGHSFAVNEISQDGTSTKNWTLASAPGKAVEISGKKDGNVTLIFVTNANWHFIVASSTQILRHYLLSIKTLPNGQSISACLDSEEHICIPEKNGYNIWRINTRSGEARDYSVTGFSHPTNAISNGQHLFFITSAKKIMRRHMSSGSIPIICSSDSKLGNPVQLLVDPKTKEILVVYQRMLDGGNCEISIHQLGSSRSLMESVKLISVPKVMKVAISFTGNLAILAVFDQATSIFEYEREHLPALAEIPGMLLSDD